MNKTAFITGANKGIGFGISKHLGMSGWNIVLGARDEQRAKAAIAELKALGVNVLGWVSIELADLNSVTQCAKTIKKDYPNLNLLINNAGIPGNMAHLSWESQMKDIQETVSVNYYGTFALTNALLPVIQANKGRIINITVPSEVSPYWHPLAYVASKAAQNAMMGVMAMDFEQKDIPVEIFSVHPGPTTTDLNGNMALPGFHNIDTVGEKMAELINDGQRHNGEFIELYPIVEE
jgi:NAD(P)-dependent dehydrogenase (short-subunit alcohol dehydrogenase family)